MGRGSRLPDVVIELLSASTERVDRGEKKRIYERIWRTGHYVMFDPETRAVEGLELVSRRYESIVPDARGYLPIASLGLALGVRPGTCSGLGGEWLRWIDEKGEVLPTGASARRGPRSSSSRPRGA